LNPFEKPPKRTNAMAKRIPLMVNVIDLVIKSTASIRQILRKEITAGTLFIRRPLIVTELTNTG
jgi:hypothetical protein